MKALPKLFLTTGAIAALIGMSWGIQMAATQDHSMAPAHAHLNLLGFVMMSIFGFYYAITPSAVTSKLAKFHYPLSLAGVVLIVPGIVMALQENGEVLAKLGSVLILISMAMYAVIVVKNGVGKD